MREIRFRAWNKDKKKMYDLASLEFWSDGSYICRPVEGDAFSTHDEDHIMQYTGLKDKNENEIYEGDMVQAMSQGSKHIGEVRWRMEGACPCYIIYPAWHDGKFWHLNGYSRGENRETCEVIGNIYSNPELITKTI